MNARPRLVALAALLCAGTCGCIKLDQRISIAADGSGEIELKYAVAESTITQLGAMRKLQASMARVAGRPNDEDEATRYAYMFLMPDEAVLTRELARYAQHGVTVEKFQVETRNAWRQVELKAHFRTLEGLAKTDAYRHTGFSLLRDRDGNYVFYRAAADRPDLKAPDYGNPTTVKMLSPMLAGLQVALRVEVPGRIVKTNAPRKGERTAMWTFSYEQNPGVLTELQRLRMVVVFDSAGLKLPLLRYEAVAEPAAGPG